MSEAKHTPGPWQQKCADYDPLTIIALVDSDGMGNLQYSRICEVDDCDSAIENARLIAAAPELLEALRFMNGKCDLYGPADRAREMARKAIARAEGRNA